MAKKKEKQVVKDMVNHLIYSQAKMLCKEEDVSEVVDYVGLTDGEAIVAGTEQIKKLIER